MWYFKIVPNFTRRTAPEIMYNNFELLLVVFMPNISKNQAITYTYTIHEKLLDSDWLRTVKFKCNTSAKKCKDQSQLRAQSPIREP